MVVENQTGMDGVSRGGKGANFMGFAIVTVNFISAHLLIDISLSIFRFQYEYD